MTVLVTVELTVEVTEEVMEETCHWTPTEVKVGSLREGEQDISSISN